MQSPSYSPHQASSHINSPYNPENAKHHYSPSYGGISKSPSGLNNYTPARSPSVAGHSPASPSYSPQPSSAHLPGSHHRSNANSPSYSPTIARMNSKYIIVLITMYRHFFFQARRIFPDLFSDQLQSTSERPLPPDKAELLSVILANINTQILSYES